MAKVAVWNWKKEQVGEVSLPAEVFEYPYRRHLVWEVVKAYLAGLRAGTHKTKTARKSRARARSPSGRRARAGPGRAAAGRRSTGTAAPLTVRRRARTRRASPWARRRTP